MNKNSDQKKTTDSVNDGSMSQIRELLFGEIQRNTDKQFQQKDEQLNVLQEQLKQSTDEANKKLSQHAFDQEESLQAGLQLLKESFEQQLEQLQNTMQQEYSQLTQVIEQNHQQLQADKVERKQLANLLHQIANTLESNSEST